MPENINSSQNNYVTTNLDAGITNIEVGQPDEEQQEPQTVEQTQAQNTQNGFV